MRIHLAVGSLIAAVCLVGTIVSQAEDAPVAAPVQKTVFDNGLTLLVREDHSAPVVSVQAWCRAGSITEGQSMGAGISHVLEHMLFKGTTTRGVSVIPHEVEAKGGGMNAYTSFEQTVYHIDLPSENWSNAVDILADCMMNATIPQAELVKEKQVILREMAMGVDDPGRRSNRQMWNAAYLVHPYRYPVIGYPEIYNRITRDDVVAYYKKMYVPNNLIFVVVGDVKAADVKALLEKLTENFKMNSVEPPAIPLEPPQVSTRERHEEAPVQLSSINLVWHIPAITDPDDPALDVLSVVLGHGLSSRLYKEIQQKQGLVHSIGAGADTPGWPGLFVLSASADGDKRDAAIAAIRAELKHLKDQPVTDDECRKAVKLFISGHYSRLKTMDGQAADIGSNELLVGDPNFSDKYLANIRTVTPADVMRVAQKYLTDENLTISTLDPIGSLPKEKPTAAVQSGVNIQKFDLPNGLRLLVREDDKLPFVDVGVFCKGGVLTETSTNNGITKLMARMLVKGTQKRTADQIATTIESVGGDLNGFSGINSFGITARAMNDDLDLLLDLVAESTLTPTFPDDLLVRERDVQLAEIKSEQDQVLRACQQILRSEIYTHHPYRLNVLGTPDSLPKITRADLAAYQRQYMVPDNMVVTVFGHVKADDIRRQIEARFASMKPGHPAFQTGGPESLATNASQQVDVKKEQAVLLVGYSTTDIYNKDRYALDLITEVYSGLGSRLFVRLRDELSLCYYCGSYQGLGLETGYLAFYVGTTAPKIDQCRKEIDSEIEKLRTNGITAVELDRAKATLIGQRKVHMQDNGGVAMMAGLDELYGLGYDNFKTVDDRYRAVTLDDIKQIANKYLGNKPSAVAIVRPATKGN